MTGALGTRLRLSRGELSAIADRLAAAQTLSRPHPLPGAGGAVSAAVPPGSVEAAPTPIARLT